MHLSPVFRCAGLLTFFVVVSLAPAIPLYGDVGTTAALVSGPRLSVTNATHDFGTVAQGEALRHEFKVTNTGDAVLEIHDVQPTCGCTTAGDWPRTLKPGESGTIPLRMETAQFMGPVVKTTTIRSNDSAQPEISVALKANIWTAITLSSPMIVIPPITDLDAPARGSLIIRNEDSAPLTLTDLRSDNSLFKPELKEIAAGKEYELVVNTVTPFPARTQASKITMTTSNEKMRELSVQVVATVLPPVQIAPTEMTFTVPKLEEAERRFVVVLNHRGAKLKVTDVSTDAPGVTLTKSPAADGKQFTIGLTFPAGLEFRPDKQYVLRGKTNHEALPTFEVPIVYVGN